MDNVKNSPRQFIANLGNENQKFYGSPDGQGLLKVIELTFDHRWVYLYELVQNAIDVRATSIAIRIAEAGDALIFQHNGGSFTGREGRRGTFESLPFHEGCPFGRGFMGIGFKSVFIRFQEARISGWGWTFRYEISR